MKRRPDIYEPRAPLPVVSESDLPPRAVVEVVGYDEAAEALLVAPPQGDAPRAVLVTDAAPTPAGDVGQAAGQWPLLVGYNLSGVAPAAGELWGVEQGRVMASRFRPGLQVLNAVGPATMVAGRRPGTRRSHVRVDGPASAPLENSVHTGREIFPLAFDLTGGLKWSKESDIWVVAASGRRLAPAIYPGTYAGHHAGRRLFVVNDCPCASPSASSSSSRSSGSQSSQSLSQSSSRQSSSKSSSLSSSQSSSSSSESGSSESESGSSESESGSDSFSSGSWIQGNCSCNDQGILPTQIVLSGIRGATSGTALVCPTVSDSFPWAPDEALLLLDSPDDCIWFWDGGSIGGNEISVHALTEGLCDYVVDISDGSNTLTLNIQPPSSPPCTGPVWDTLSPFLAYGAFCGDCDPTVPLSGSPS